MICTIIKHYDMLPSKAVERIDDMKDTEEKKLLEILKDKGQPFVKKCDGYAVKMDEDKQIDYKDWEGNERTLKVPAGSYVVVDADCHCPQIRTADDFESKNKIVEKKKEEKKKDSPVIGMELMIEDD